MTRERIVNGMTQTLTVIKGEVVNGATIEICETSRRYPLLRIERHGKEMFMVPGSGELALDEASRIVESNFAIVCKNAMAAA